jgi:hypothetical protein
MNTTFTVDASGNITNTIPAQTIPVPVNRLIFQLQDINNRITNLQAQAAAITAALNQVAAVPTIDPVVLTQINTALKTTTTTTTTPTT